MPQTLTPTDFLKAPGILLDVRSPAEYEQGHIPGAISFPLFDNRERAQVGTCYKQQGHEVAVELGLAIAGPKLATFVTKAKALACDRPLRIHCWRGGMRSGSMAWLMETAGMQVCLLEGGYKAFRRWVRSTLAAPRHLVILGGMTGTGKTDLLLALAEQGEQILDLEHLANHRGSSYGNLMLPAQPSTEHFENLIALRWSELALDRWVWIEAESRQVGVCRIPDEIFLPMMRSPVLQITRSRAERIALLLQVYGQADPEELILATERLTKRLGGQLTQKAVEAIRGGELAAAVAIVLDYYDKTYTYDLQRRQVPIHTVDISNLSLTAGASQLLAAVQRLFDPDSLSKIAAIV